MVKNKFKLKSNVIFYGILFTGVMFFAVMYKIASGLYQQIVPMWEMSSHKLESLCGCTEHLSFFNHPFLYTFAAIIILGMAFFAVYSIYSMLELNKSTKSFLKMNMGAKGRESGTKLRKISERIGIAGRVFETEIKSPEIFCYGFWRPKICISSALVKELSGRELTAVLMHEKSHMDNNEPVKLYLIKFVSRTLAFVPGIKDLAQKYISYSEIAADEKATCGFSKKEDLVSALCKILKMRERRVIEANLAVTFFAASNERIGKLIDEGYEPNENIVFMKFSKAMIFIAATFAVFSGINDFNYSTMRKAERESCAFMEPQKEDKNTSCDKNTELKSECNNNYNLNAGICQEDIDNILGNEFK